MENNWIDEAEEKMETSIKKLDGDIIYRELTLEMIKDYLKDNELMKLDGDIMYENLNKNTWVKQINEINTEILDLKGRRKLFIQNFSPAPKLTDKGYINIKRVTKKEDGKVYYIFVREETDELLDDVFISAYRNVEDFLKVLKGYNTKSFHTSTGYYILREIDIEDDLVYNENIWTRKTEIEFPDNKIATHELKFFNDKRPEFHIKPNDLNYKLGPIWLVNYETNEFMKLEINNEKMLF